MPLPPPRPSQPLCSWEKQVGKARRKGDRIVASRETDPEQTAVLAHGLGRQKADITLYGLPFWPRLSQCYWGHKGGFGVSLARVPALDLQKRFPLRRNGIFQVGE